MSVQSLCHRFCIVMALWPPFLFVSRRLLMRLGPVSLVFTLGSIGFVTTCWFHFISFDFFFLAHLTRFSSDSFILLTSSFFFFLQSAVFGFWFFFFGLELICRFWSFWCLVHFSPISGAGFSFLVWRFLLGFFCNDWYFFLSHFYGHFRYLFNIFFILFKVLTGLWPLFRILQWIFDEFSCLFKIFFHFIWQFWLVYGHYLELFFVWKNIDDSHATFLFVLELLVIFCCTFSMVIWYSFHWLWRIRQTWGICVRFFSHYVIMRFVGDFFYCFLSAVSYYFHFRWWFRPVCGRYVRLCRDFWAILAGFRLLCYILERFFVISGHFGGFFAVKHWNLKVEVIELA